MKDEAAIAALIEQAQEIQERSGDLEAVLRMLRTQGCWQIDSIKVVRHLLGIGLGKAKKLVMLSDTWNDRLADTVAFHDQLEAAFNMAIHTRFQADLDGFSPAQLSGFFVGWPNPPGPETLYRLLQNSYRISLAMDEDTGRVVGFAQAISDGVLSAYISLLEVLPEHQGRGIGTELLGHLLAQLGHLYAIDLSCDPELAPFYERLGLQRGMAMYRRRYHRQDGATES